MRLLRGIRLWGSSLLLLVVRGDDTTIITSPAESHIQGFNREVDVSLRKAPERADHQPNPESANAGSTQDESMAVWITWPPNDVVFFVGDVMLTFETRGFTPSKENPLEVLIPQNGERPILLDKGNSFTLEMDTPCTQLVTLSATVRGKRVSSSVMFSTVLDKATIISARAPLPADAAWGARSDAFISRIREHEGSKNLHGDDDMKKPNRIVLEDATGLDVPQKGSTFEAEGPPRPISLVFVGSWRFDGQKHIWLQQMEHLPRAEFAPKYLTFEEQEQEQEENGRSNAESNGPNIGASTMERRLYKAGVPLVRASLPRVDVSSVSNSSSSSSISSSGSRGEKRMTSLKEMAFAAVLESFESAGGEPYLMSPKWTRAVFQGIADAIRSVSPDVLVVANARTLGDVVLTKAARWAAGERGCKIVMDFPNIDPARGVDVDVLATPSHYVARHPDVTTLAVSAGARVVVIPPGVPDASSSVVLVEGGGGAAAAGASDRSGGSFARAFALDSSNISVLEKLGCCAPDCFVVGFAGRLAPEKGPALFLAAAEVLSKLLPSAVFVVVGDGPLRPALEAMAERKGIASRVYFTGWADGADLQHLLAGMSLLLNPSLASSETFCITNIEAMSVGTPVAAFGTAGMLEYLAPDVNALVLDDAHPSAVATRVAQLLLDRPRLEGLAAAGRRDVSSNFRADTALDRWAELYRSLGRGGGTGQPPQSLHRGEGSIGLGKWTAK